MKKIKYRKWLLIILLLTVLVGVYACFIKPIKDTKKIALNESQYYIIHYGTEPNEIIDGFFERNPGFPSTEFIVDTLHDYNVTSFQALYYFNIGNLPNGSIYTYITIQQPDLIRKLRFNTKDLGTYVFSFYKEAIFPSANTGEALYPKENEDGIYLSYETAKTLNISTNCKDTSLTFTVYIPISVSTSSYDVYHHAYELANLTYVKKEITIPVLGVISEVYPHLDSCFGYINHDYMDQLWHEAADNYVPKENETYWSTNTYQIYTDEENMLRIKKAITDFDSQSDIIHLNP